MFSAAVSESVATARRNALGDVLRRSAAREPNKLALVHRDTSYTYAELNERVNACANALAERGVTKGQRVALLSHNNAGFVVVTFALAKLGAICVPVNFMLNADEVAYILEHSGARGLIVEDALVRTAERAMGKASTDIGLRVVIGAAAPEGWEASDTLLAHEDTSEPVVDIADDDPLQLMYTSGTESRPKGTIMTSRSLLAQYVSCIVGGRFSRDDVALHALPLFHVAAQHCMLTPYASLGATNVVLDGPEPGALLEAIERHGATSLFCPPTVWISLLRHPDFDTRDLSSLKRGYYGASIMPVEIVKELSKRLPNIDLFNFYGQTEMSALALVLGPEDQLRKPGSAGRAAIYVETRLIDDASADVAANLSEDDLKQAAVVTATVLLGAANADERVPRMPLPAPRCKPTGCCLSCGGSRPRLWRACWPGGCTGGWSLRLNGCWPEHASLRRMRTLPACPRGR